jgi:hypothetical protein
VRGEQRAERRRTVGVAIDRTEQPIGHLEHAAAVLGVRQPSVAVELSRLRRHVREALRRVAIVGALRKQQNAAVSDKW